MTERGECFSVLFDRCLACGSGPVSVSRWDNDCSRASREQLLVVSLPTLLTLAMEKQGFCALTSEEFMHYRNGTLSHMLFQAELAIVVCSFTAVLGSWRGPCSRFYPTMGESLTAHEKREAQALPGCISSCAG